MALNTIRDIDRVDLSNLRRRCSKTIGGDEYTQDIDFTVDIK